MKSSSLKEIFKKMEFYFDIIIFLCRYSTQCTQYQTDRRSKLNENFIYIGEAHSTIPGHMYNTVLQTCKIMNYELRQNMFMYSHIQHTAPKIYCRIIFGLVFDDFSFFQYLEASSEILYFSFSFYNHAFLNLTNTLQETEIPNSHN